SWARLDRFATSSAVFSDFFIKVPHKLNSQTSVHKLYSGELTLSLDTALRAEGCRFGYLNSDETKR
ncbi:MAG: hypothetical protein KA368_17805, partial [Acidobacteria bacterium]|nr:hypothetical protein [Acidobacteriota bacterium]